MMTDAQFSRLCDLLYRQAESDVLDETCNVSWFAYDWMHQDIYLSALYALGGAVTRH